MEDLKIVKIVLAVLLLGCLLDMPYGYFMLVRFLGMIGFSILAIKYKEEDNKNLYIFWLASAILINPIIKIPLGRDLWNVIDVVWAVILFLSIKNPKND
jgi:hypothetical protein